MKTIELPSYPLFSLRSLLADGAAIAFVCLVPAMAHLTGIPVYFIEPMRLMLVVAMLYSHRANAYLLAVLLPLVSFLVSGHPEPMKMIVIMAELLLNTWLFLALLKATARPFVSMFASVVVSKLFCYAAYLVVFSWAFVVEEAAPLFVGVQLAMTLVISLLTTAVVNQRK